MLNADLVYDLALAVQMEVLAPVDADTIEPQRLAELLDMQACPFYLFTGPLAEFVEPIRVQALIGCAGFAAVSVHTHSDRGSTLAISPAGQLILDVDKDLYERLGLEGRPAPFSRKGCPGRRVISVDLAGRASRRLDWALRERLAPLQLAVCLGRDVTWPPDAGGYDTATCQLERKLAPVSCGWLARGRSLTVPDFAAVLSSGAAFEEEFEVAYEWLGAAHGRMDAVLDAQLGEHEHFTRPSMARSAEQLTHSSGALAHATVLGMLSTSYVCAIVERMLALVREGSTGAPWLAATIWGFEDTPESWTGVPHSHGESGDNMLSVIALCTGQVLVVQAVGDLDGLS